MTEEWLVDRNEKTYHVKLEKRFPTGNEVSINGKLFIEEVFSHNRGSQYNFDVDGINLRLVINRPRLFIKTKHDLYVNHEWISPFSSIEKKKRG